jgi:hypothetical protein
LSRKKWLSTSSCLRLIHSHPFTATSLLFGKSSYLAPLFSFVLSVLPIFKL